MVRLQAGGGQTGSQSGLVDGDAISQALFDTPTYVVSQMDAQYILDDNLIRKISTDGMYASV